MPIKKREVKELTEVQLLKQEKKEADVWRQFAEREALTEKELERFFQYYELLMAHNKCYNLTAHTNLLAVVRHHFMDSLALRKVHDMSQVTGLADVGTGAGFPALPLKIMYPHIPMLLIEPNKKRQSFLQEVVRVLELDGVEFFSNDWRTFIRTTQGEELNLFVSRATMAVSELARMFKPSSAYKGSTLVYWASEQWEIEPKIAEFVRKDEPYRIGSCKRRLIFLGKKSV